MTLTIESIHEKHQEVLDRIIAFERTIPRMSDIGKRYAPTAVQQMRALCSVAMSPFSQPLPSFSLPKTGVEIIDNIEKELSQQVAEIEADFLKESLLRADTALDKILRDIEEGSSLYK